MRVQRLGVRVGGVSLGIRVGFRNSGLAIIVSGLCLGALSHKVI